MRNTFNTCKSVPLCIIDTLSTYTHIKNKKKLTLNYFAAIKVKILHCI